MICNGCGGILGRDCFNSQECEWIAAQERVYDSTELQRAVYEVDQLRAELEHWKKRYFDLEKHYEEMKSKYINK